MKTINFLAVIFLTAQLNAQHSRQSLLPVSRHAFVVIAHRGDHEHVPENTVASVQDAIKAGVDYVEMDLRTTRDGYLMLMHDGSVDRMTNGKGYIKDLPMDSLRNLKIRQEGSETKYRIPEFRDMLKACKGHINIYLDFKDADVAETYKQIQDAGMEKHVVVYLNKSSQYGEWKKVAPDMPLMTSLPENIITEKDFDQFLEKISIQVFDNLYDNSMIAMAKKKGIAVWLDAEEKNEDATTWKKVISKNVQGIQTDHPEELIAYLKQQHIR
jgi:glycerophosphoryl diester phosphodiesterase